MKYLECRSKIMLSVEAAAVIYSVCVDVCVKKRDERWGKGL